MNNLKQRVCKCCEKPLSNKNSVYCSNLCQRDFEVKIKIARWLKGEEKGYMGKAQQLKPFVRKYIHEARGTACCRCGWDEKHPIDGATLTEIDHIDGDSSNCTPENLRVLCPNCHSMTPTFRARNRDSKRIRLV